MEDLILHQKGLRDESFSKKLDIDVLDLYYELQKDGAIVKDIINKIWVDEENGNPPHRCII